MIYRAHAGKRAEADKTGLRLALPTLICAAATARILGEARDNSAADDVKGVCRGHRDIEAADYPQ